MSYNWSADFTPVQGMRISPNRVWPSGSFDVSGNLNYSIGDVTRAFSLDTAIPLAYDPGCEGQPPFTAGEIQALLTTKQDVGFSLVSQHCGVLPTVVVLSGVRS